MIQFNLLPDVKLQFIKAQRLKRMVITVSFIVTSVCLLIFILLFLFVRVSQKNQIEDLTSDINDGINKIESIQDLDKILTVQNQLKSLPALHSGKVVSSRMFGYLGKLKPATASISNIEVDFDGKTMSVKGTADSLATIQQFADTLKFTVFPKKTDPGKPAVDTKAFNSVVLKSFSVSTGNNANTQKKTVDYEIGFLFEPDIFANNGEAPELTVKKPSDIVNVQTGQ